MKKELFILLLVGMMVVIAFIGCEKTELAKPNEIQNLTSRIGETDGCIAGIVEPVALDEFVTAKLDSLFSDYNNTLLGNGDSWVHYTSDEILAPFFKVIRNNDEFLEIGGDFDFEFDKYCIVGGRVWGGSQYFGITYKELKVYEDCSSIYVVKRYYPANDYSDFPPLYFWDVFPKERVGNDPELVIEDEYENE